MPPGGAMIKRTWVMRYSTVPTRRPGSLLFQSWDTASKGGAENDWSVLHHLAGSAATPIARTKCGGPAP
jgi:hypothetical protein